MPWRGRNNGGGHELIVLSVVSDRHRHRVRSCSFMITFGIGLSSMPDGTATCCIEWTRGLAVATSPRIGHTDEQLDQFARKAEAVGTDAPLDWPTEFVTAVRQLTSLAWKEPVIRIAKASYVIRSQDKNRRILMIELVN